MRKYSAKLILFILITFSFTTKAEDNYSLLNDFGSVGLIDIPTARMQTDATFWAMFSMQDVMDTYSLNFQALPFLETSFRYHIHSPREGKYFYFDRSYGVKLKILKERKFIPNLSIGLQDIVGTGLNSSEYLVASKKINRFDLTLGMGWGRFADRSSFKNPLSLISKSFNERTGTIDKSSPSWGKFRPGDWFSGKDVGLFGGIEYEIINNKLYGVFEYNSDQYQYESARNTVEIKSPYSFGIVWKFIQNTQLGVSWQHGSELGFKISSLFDTKNLMPKFPKTLNYSTNLPKEGLPPKTKYNWYNNIYEDAKKSGIIIRKAKVLGNKLYLEYGNQQYMVYNDAIERLIFFSELHLPRKLNEIEFISNDHYTNTFTTVYKRDKNKSILNFREDKKAYLDNISYEGPKRIGKTNINTNFLYPNAEIKYGIDMRYRVFDPDNPFNKQFFLKVNPSVYIADGWEIQSMLRINIYNDFDTIKTVYPSKLPKVRSDLQHYLQKSPTGIQSLILQSNHKPFENVYLKTSSGILEDMYIGSGFEVLYKAFESNIGIGANIFYVKKRSHIQWFSTQKYETWTGFASLFWALPIYEIDLGFHYGYYLAKDRGFTIELNRVFNSGWQVGLFGTKTNVSAEDFGEGSFDKGFYLKIPLQNFFNNPSLNTYSTILRPIQRDGGARLDDYASSLWQKLRLVEQKILYDTKERTYE